MEELAIEVELAREVAETNIVVKEPAKDGEGMGVGIVEVSMTGRISAE